jgi:hypothetical protein
MIRESHPSSVRRSQATCPIKRHSCLQGSSLQGLRWTPAIFDSHRTPLLAAGRNGAARPVGPITKLRLLTENRRRLEWLVALNTPCLTRQVRSFAESAITIMGREPDKTTHTRRRRTVKISYGYMYDNRILTFGHSDVHGAETGQHDHQASSRLQIIRVPRLWLSLSGVQIISRQRASSTVPSPEPEKLVPKVGGKWASVLGPSHWVVSLTFDFNN